MPADVYYACTLHALSVEEEEVMGLLIGKVNYLKNFKIMKNKNLLVLLHSIQKIFLSINLPYGINTE